MLDLILLRRLRFFWFVGRAELSLFPSVSCESFLLVAMIGSPSQNGSLLSEPCARKEVTDPQTMLTSVSQKLGGWGGVDLTPGTEIIDASRSAGFN